MAASKREIFSNDIKISKTLSWLLRHSAISEGLNIGKDGYIEVETLLAHSAIQQRNCTIADIIRIVKNDEKGRYTLTSSPKIGKLKIKANQGHSIQEIQELSLRPIKESKEVPMAVHGTYFRYWFQIKNKGLKRFNRNHIHFSIDDNVSKLNVDAKISGFRNDCQILIYIDLEKAIQDGIEFFLSENNVLLSPGENGVIATKYFLKAIKRRTGKELNIKNNHDIPTGSKTVGTE